MIGLTPEEAAKRLDAMGAAYEFVKAAPRKRVLGKTEPRVMRVKSVKEGAALELLVGDFRVYEPANSQAIGGAASSCANEDSASS